MIARPPLSRATRSFVALACAFVLLTVALVIVFGGPAWAQDPSTTLPPAPNIIPRPNSGVAPTDAGDRGGTLQAAMFFLIVGAMAGMGLFVHRQSRRARAARGY